MDYCIISTINTRGNINNYFHTIRSTKHLVDWLLADYIDNYMLGSGKSDKYGFSLLPA